MEEVFKLLIGKHFIKESEDSSAVLFTKMPGFASFFGVVNFEWTNNQIITKNKPWRASEREHMVYWAICLVVDNLKSFPEEVLRMSGLSFYPK